MQLEMQNCLSEALPYAVAHRGPVIPTGSGDFVLRRSVPIFCQSTDGFAGMMLVSVERFPSVQALRCAFALIGDPGDDYVESLVPAWFVPDGGLLCDQPEDPADACPF